MNEIYNILMIFLLQECISAAVKVDEKLVSEIGQGLVNFVGFTQGDDFELVDKMIKKLLKLRIFKDKNGLTNRSIFDIDGEILSISQFTLYASLKDGNRPSFVRALNKEKSIVLYDYFVKRMQEGYSKCKFGIFHADMKVSLINDGPFTIILDSKELFHG